VSRTEEIELRLLLEAIFQRYHYDFRGYSMASLKRRLGQAREQFGCASFSQLQDRVLHEPTTLPGLLNYLTVQVSELFRDPAYFRALREAVVPHLRTYPSLKVWVAGCAAGEELYSLVILFREEGLEERTLFYGTDINPEGPTTLTAIVDTGSGSIMSTIFGQVTTLDKQCTFMPTIGSSVVP